MKASRRIDVTILVLQESGEGFRKVCEGRVRQDCLSRVYLDFFTIGIRVSSMLFIRGAIFGLASSLNY